MHERNSACHLNRGCWCRCRPPNGMRHSGRKAACQTPIGINLRRGCDTQPGPRRGRLGHPSWHSRVRPAKRDGRGPEGKRGGACRTRAAATHAASGIGGVDACRGCEVGNRYVAAIELLRERSGRIIVFEHLGATRPTRELRQSWRAIAPDPDRPLRRERVFQRSPCESEERTVLWMWLSTCLFTSFRIGRSVGRSGRPDNRPAKGQPDRPADRPFPGHRRSRLVYLHKLRTVGRFQGGDAADSPSHPSRAS